MKIAVAAETDAGEPRVAAVSDTVKKLIGLGFSVAVEAGEKIPLERGAAAAAA